MSSIDQQFVEFIVKSLVGNPDAVQIERRVDEKGVLLELTVDPEDLGRIIGKRGATAQSLRTLLRALGTKNDARYNLKIIDNGPSDYERPARQETDHSDSGSSSAPVSRDDDDENTENVNSSQPANDNSAVNPADENDVVESSEPELDSPSNISSKHRRDLDDLDDLDI